MIMNFNEEGKYVWAEVGGITTDIQVDVTWKSEWDTKKHLLRLVDGAIVVAPDDAYARSRKAAYDALNQFELMTDDARDGTTTHAEAIEAIKAEFPKTTGV